MTDSSTNFEYQLQQMKPTSFDEQLPETFYQAGWEACERSKATLVPKALGGKRLPSFSGGLLCGILVAVGFFTWREWPNNPEPRQQIAAPDLHDNESEIAHNDEADGSGKAFSVSDSVAATGEVNVPTIHWKSLTGTFSIWGDSGPSAFDNTIPAAARPLSVAARQHWSCVVVAENAVSFRGTQNSTLGPETAEHETPLRTFPATEERLRELL